MSESATATTENTTEITLPRQPRAQRILRSMGWTGFFFVLLLLFTLIKLPEIRLKNYVQGTLSSLLASKGISVSAASTEISFLFGISYTMKDVTLVLPPPDSPVKVERIEVSPSIFPMILGKIAGTVKIEQGSGFLKASVSTSAASGPKNEMSLSFRAKDFNLGRLALLQILAGLRGGMNISGDGSFSGDLNQPSSWNGDIKAELSKIALEQQSMMGFNLPPIRVAEGHIELGASSGKATIKTLRLGKPGGNDDLTATVTGDIALGKTWDSSMVNLKTKFSISAAAMKSLSLLDMILQAGKQPDGSYAYNLAGPIGAPAATPAK